MKIQGFISALALVAATLTLGAQSPVSGFMQGQGRGSVALSYTAETYDNVFLVPSIEADGVPVFNEVNVNSISLYGVYGLSDRLDVVVSLPYISSRGAASTTILSETGFENKRQGIQDLSAFLKFKAHSVQLGTSSLDFLLAAGVRTPLGDYPVDEGLQSILAIGNGATSGTGLAMAHFKAQNGIFLTTQAGYSLRGGDVPDALLGEIKAGIAGRGFYADVWFAGQTSDGGVNILGEGFVGNFPATDVSFHRIGANVFIPVVGGLGAGIGASRYLSGRNIGQSTGVSGSIVLSF
ncbi:hypothetical protein QWY85_01020 [Neolewinella lacunae]|uniref:Uncharacterized protein n=1 Tax=Neolewinella lacunae TaxID=1517758 RepID=A0A923PPH1_9BACT|nr:hypothetical protein [Neolewinella lacunae]MBC6995013.1 hypothetical protein [Neolewinella lacunae]MDN3633216.1 hypothetical protein [Neolewinella lacunae]